MGFYARVVFPPLCDWALGGSGLGRRRDEALATAGGEILEIGFGTGLNLAHYPAHVRKIATVEPNPAMNRRALRRIAGSPIEVETYRLGGEALPFAPETFDCVVSTFTLCSIREVDRALAEVHRVLRPGGRFLFLEHGLSDDEGVARWQRRLNPIERVVGDGCRLDLDVPKVLGAQPFERVEAERFAISWLPRTHGTMIRGAAYRGKGT